MEEAVKQSFHIMFTHAFTALQGILEEFTLRNTNQGKLFQNTAHCSKSILTWEVFLMLVILTIIEFVLV